MTGLRIFGVHQQIKIVLQPKAGHQQPGFLTAA
jgi:hypothetical protein